MDILTFEKAKKTEGTAFEIHLDDGTRLDLTLVSVTQGKETPDFPGKTRLPFSMFFEGTQGILCPQALYTLENSQLGKHDIFLCPIGHDPQHDIYRYQAVFC